MQKPNNLRALVSSTTAKKKSTIGLIAAILILLIGSIVWYVQSSRSQDEVINTRVGTEQQAVKSELDRLLANPVPASRPIDEQTEYFEELASLYAIKGDYSSAITMMDRRMAIETADLEYYDYIEIAYYYHELNDAESALRFLDLAEASLVKVDRPSIGYSYQEWVENINQLREEYK